MRRAPPPPPRLEIREHRGPLAGALKEHGGASRLSELRGSDANSPPTSPRPGSPRAALACEVSSSLAIDGGRRAAPRSVAAAHQEARNGGSSPFASAAAAGRRSGRAAAAPPQFEPRRKGRRRSRDDVKEDSPSAFEAPQHRETRYSRLDALLDTVADDDDDDAQARAAAAAAAAIAARRRGEL